MMSHQERSNHTCGKSLEAISEAHDVEEAQIPDTSQASPLPSTSAGTPEEPPVLETSTDTTAKSLSQAHVEKCVSSLVLVKDPDQLFRAALDEKMGMLVRVFLFRYRRKEFITRKDILKMVIGEHEDHFLEIFHMASARIELVYGIDVLEVDPTIHCYALLNKLNITYDGMHVGVKGIPKIGLLIFILSVLFMKGNRATEEDVWKALNRLDIYSGRYHFLYGEPKSFITKFLVLERYLDYRKVSGSDPPRYEFWWGPRAHAEINKIKLLEFWAKINDADSPTFSSLYKKALKGEKRRVVKLHRAKIFYKVKSEAPSTVTDP